jgi:hypothetical protein
LPRAIVLLLERDFCISLGVFGLKGRGNVAPVIVNLFDGFASMLISKSSGASTTIPSFALSAEPRRIIPPLLSMTTSFSDTLLLLSCLVKKWPMPVSCARVVGKEERVRLRFNPRSFVGVVSLVESKIALELATSFGNQ